jgi:hypothetical protein
MSLTDWAKELLDKPWIKSRQYREIRIIFRELPVESEIYDMTTNKKMKHVKNISIEGAIDASCWMATLECFKIMCENVGGIEGKTEFSDETYFEKVLVKEFVIS